MVTADLVANGRYMGEVTLSSLPKARERFSTQSDAGVLCWYLVDKIEFHPLPLGSGGARSPTIYARLVSAEL